ncbi:MAG TPA: pilus assembly protein PilM [Candidatus Omnitrophota bacterium]|nr:pilus assembly protein PilM [Candidatus Omnitrophota bacterium]
MKQFLDQYISFVRKVLPQNESGITSIGLDIEASSCRMVELTKRGTAFEIVQWANQPIENGDTAKALRSLLEKAKHPSRNPVSSIQGKGTLIRCVSMPRMPVEDLRKSLSLEADKYFPFAQDQVYTDCYILDPDSQDKKMNVLVAASKKDIIDSRVKLLNSIGLQADYITLNPIAIANVMHALGGEVIVAHKNSEGDSGLALLHLGEGLSNLVIFSGRNPKFNRDIYIGSQDLIKRVSNALRISLPDAENILGNPKDKLPEILTACESSLMNLISEMRLSFDYFTTEYNVHIKTLVLTGSVTGVPAFVDYFAKNLDIKVETWNPFSGLKIADDVSKDELFKNANHLWGALGSALCQYD